MRSRAQGLPALDLFSGVHPRPSTSDRDSNHWANPPTSSAAFEGPYQQEIATAFLDSGEDGGPAGLYNALLSNFNSGRPLDPIASRASAIMPDLLSGPVGRSVPLVLKRVFDYYFRDDLYGTQIRREPIILSSGSFDEQAFGLPSSLKDCVRYSMDKNWYGYSDSLGRSSVRRALARLENARASGMTEYDVDNIAVVLGGTAAISSVVDMIVEDAGTAVAPKAVACVPNYPPLVASLARRLSVDMVPTPLVNGEVGVGPVLDALKAAPTIVLMQTVVNPWGLRVSESNIARVIRALPRDCYLILDECHDAFGPQVRLSSARRDPRVISVHSLSKRWAAPGLKAGWLVAAKPFVDRFYHHASTTYGGPPALLYLLLEMFGLFERARLTGEDLGSEREYLRLEYGLDDHRWQRALEDYLSSASRMETQVLARRTYALDRLSDAGIPALTPSYSINLLIRIGDLPSYHLYRRLVQEANVSVLPGLLTMGDCAGTARISPCLNAPLLEEGLDRLIGWATEQHG